MTSKIRFYETNSRRVSILFIKEKLLIIKLI